MIHFHDPVRQLGYLQQCLSHSRRPIGLFLSAGCPLAVRIQNNGENKPIIPDIAGLTKAIRNGFSDSKYKDQFQRIVRHFEDDKHPEPNIEEILSHIRSLHQVAGCEKVRGLTADELSKLDDEISRKIVDIADKSLPNNDTAYHKVAMWIGAIPREEPIEIFTTNYDLLMEQALEEFQVPYFDGFTGSRLAFFDSYSMEEDQLPKRWARLWKLHGSINWKQKNNVVSRSGSEKIDAGEYRYIIHPSHLKYDESRRMPYLAMMDRLRSFLKKPSPVLIVNGYSFGDYHLNEILADGLRGNSTAIIFALVYGNIEKYDNAIKIACTTHNFNLLAEDEAVIGTRRAAWVEKEKGEIPEYPEIEWILKDKNKQDSIKSAHFKLGDFYILGKFLEELIGKEIKEGREKKIEIE